MDTAVVFIFYGSIFFCAIASSVKIARFITTPLHLKWEYYRGSSIYETTEWWTRKQAGLSRRLWSVLIDLLSLREYYGRNRKYWLPLYAFHIGIYLIILWHIWLFAASLITDTETASPTGLVWGHISTALAFAGGLAVLVLRIADDELRLYYPPLHYIKWVLMLATLAGGVYAVHVHFDGSMPATLKYVKGQLTFEDISHKLHPSPSTAAHVLLGSLWLIYLPFSHILQLFFRYYHALRFDEVPNVRGGAIERRVKGLLEKPVSWSAVHIQQGKTWGEVVTQLPGKTEEEAPE